MFKSVLIFSCIFLAGICPCFANIAWQTDYNAAALEAQKSNKPLFILFTGSDWCTWCMRLDKEVLSTPEFSSAVGNSLVFVKVDFPVKEQLPAALANQNQKLKEQYDVQGFPVVILVSPSGSEIGRLGYDAGGGAKYAQKVQNMIKSAS